MSRAAALRRAVIRADVVRSTGVRHAWRRRWRDRAYERTAPERRRLLAQSMWQEAAAAIGATMTALSPTVAQIRRGGASTVVMGETTRLNDVVSVELAGEKPLVHQLLADTNLPVPEHILVAGPRERVAAEEFLLAAHGPCVVKPCRGSGGDGVTGEVRAPAQLRRALRCAWRYDSRALVEHQGRGDVYRALVLEGKILAAVRRRSPHVEGDGRRTVEQLLLDAYDERLAAGAAEPVKRLVADLDCVFTLGAAGLGLRSVPAPGLSVAVGTVSNYNRAADNETVEPEELGPVQAEVTAAAAAVGLRLAGVDIVASSLARPLAETGGIILEVNGRPALHHHRLVNRPADAPMVAASILEVLLRDSARARA